MLGSKDYGAIALVGMSSSGKTAYLIALDLSTDDRDRLAAWDLDKRSGLSQYIRTLGEDLGDTGRYALTRTKVTDTTGYLELYQGYHRLRFPMPRFLRHRYRVAIPDVAGEAYNLVAGREAEDDKEQLARASLLKQLRNCKALICLIDVKPEVDPEGKLSKTERRKKEHVEVSDQLKALENVLTLLTERRSNRNPLFVTVALTKCDRLESDEKLVRLRVEESHRWSYFEVQNHLDALNAGFRMHAEETISYTLDDVDAALIPDPRDEFFEQKKFWGDDSVHHDAVARDWFRCQRKDGYQWIEKLSTMKGITLDLVLMSSWGGATPTVEYGGRQVEVVPKAGEISPIRLMAPIRNVLDRLHERRTRRSLTRRLGGAAIFLVLVLGGWRGYLGYLAGHAESAFAKDRTEEAQSALDKAKFFVPCSPVAWMSSFREVTVGLIRNEHDPQTAVELMTRYECFVPSGSTLRREVLEHAVDSVGDSIGAAFVDLDAFDGSKTKALMSRTLSVLDAVNQLSKSKMAFDDESAELSWLSESDKLRSKSMVHSALVRALELRMEQPAGDRLERIDAVLSLALEAGDLASLSGDSETQQYVRRASQSCFTELLTLPEFEITHDRTTLNAGNEIVKIGFLKALAEKPPMDSWRSQILESKLTEIGEGIWSHLGVAVEDAVARDPGSVEAMTHLLTYLGESFSVFPCSEDDVEAVLHSLSLKKLVRGIRGTPFPKGDESADTIKSVRAWLLAKDESTLPEKDRVEELDRDFDSIRGALVESMSLENSDVPLSDWVKISKAVVTEGSILEELLEKANLYSAFASIRDSAATLSNETSSALLSILQSNDKGRGNPFSLVGRIGVQLASDPTTLPGAHSLRMSLERLGNAGEISMEDLRRATGLFQEPLLTPDNPLDILAQEKSIRSLLDLLAESIDPTSDLIFLWNAGRSKPTSIYLQNVAKDVVSVLISELKRHRNTSKFSDLLATIRSELKLVLSRLDPGEVDRWLQDYGTLIKCAESGVALNLVALVYCARVFQASLTGVPEGSSLPTEAMHRALDPLLSGSRPLLAIGEEASEVLIQIGKHLAASSETLSNAYALRRAVGVYRDTAEELVDEIRGEWTRSLWAPPNPLSKRIMVVLLGGFIEDLSDSNVDRAGLALLFSMRHDGSLPHVTENLERLFSQVALVFGGVENEISRESLFREDISKAAELFHRDPTSKSTGAESMNFEVLKKECDRVGAQKASGAIQSLSATMDFLREVPIHWVEVKRADGSSCFMSRDEVSIEEYKSFLQRDEKLTIQYSVRSTPLRFTWEGMNDAYAQRASDIETDEVILDQAVFAVDGVAVQRFLQENGLRLPTKSEWCSAYARLNHKGVVFENAESARSRDMIDRLNDRTSEGLRGMQFGVREWVWDEDQGRLTALGASWFNSMRNATTNSDDSPPAYRLDIGFRVARDFVPDALASYLELVN